MPESPDFDQIARTVLRAISDNIRGECPPLAFGPVRSALVQVWNARGAADKQVILTALDEKTEIAPWAELAALDR